MHKDLRVLRVGFEQGLFTREDVRSWVDRQVEMRDELPTELLELTTIAHMHDNEIVKLLEALESPSDPWTLARIELAVLAENYRSGGLSLETCIARLVSLLSGSDGFTDQERASVASLECAYDLAAYATYGSVEDVEAELIEFLATYQLSRGAEPV